MRLKGIVAAVMLWAALAALALGQEKRPLNEDLNSRFLKGVVSDQNNKPVRGAVVQLKDTKSLQIRSFYTEADGAYHFAGLGTNTEYQVKADFEGATSGTKTLSVFDSHKTASINLKLK